MKIFSNRKVIQKMAIVLLILTVFNFTIPMTSEAYSIKKAISKVKKAAGDIINKGVTAFVLAIGDSALNVGQSFLFGMKIDTDTINLSPENIFTNSIPFLNANFMQPNQGSSSSGSGPTMDEKLDTIERKLTNWASQNENRFIGTDKEDDDEFNNYEEIEERQRDNVQKIITFLKKTDFADEIIHNPDHLYDGCTNYLMVMERTIGNYMKNNSKSLTTSQTNGLVAKLKHIYAASDGDGGTYQKVDYSDDDYYAIYVAIYKNMDGNILYYAGDKSLAEELGGVISKWYYILRNISLIAMLSVLAYIGIRIVLSSVAQEKSKYKNMLMDWLIGICLLFTLHLIMAFISGIIGNITSGISALAGLNNGTSLMENAREIAMSENEIGFAFMYCILVVMTYIYLVYYIKRALNLAFLTVIAPLVALTYPIDKITDGKAQAFNMWLKEYIFYTLIQPVHLLLYVVFVSSASQLAEKNILYALVALWFIRSAEGIVRKFFGFDSKAPNVGGPGGLAAVGMTAHAVKDIGRLLKGDKSNSGNSKSSGGQDSGGSNENAIREKGGPSGLSGFGDNKDKEDNDIDSPDAEGQDFAGDEDNDTDSLDAEGQDFAGDGDNDTDSLDAEGQDFAGDGDNDTDSLDVEGQDFAGDGDNDTDSPDEDGTDSSDNKGDSGSGSTKARRLKGVAKGAKKGAKFTAGVLKVVAKGSGVGIGALTGVAYGIASGEGVISGIAKGATVGSEVADIGISSFSGVGSSVKNGVSSVYGKVNKNRDLNKQYNDFVNNKQNIKKFKEEYGKDYKTKMEDARQFVDAGYTNFDDIKKGFKIQKRNGFNQEQAINIMDLDKKIGNTILNEKESKKYRDKITETVGKKDGERVISALEDIQTGFLGDGPVSKQNKSGNKK